MNKTIARWLERKVRGKGSEEEGMRRREGRGEKERRRGIEEEWSGGRGGGGWKEGRRKGGMGNKKHADKHSIEQGGGERNLRHAEYRTSDYIIGGKCEKKQKHRVERSLDM